MNDILSFSQLLELLTGLTDSKSSGTLYIRSESNHVVTIALEKGKIYALFYGPKRGRKAIPMISQIAAGSYKFEPTGLIGISHELPSTPEILNHLRQGNGPQTAEISRPATITADVGISSDGRYELCQQLKGILADYLGPIADMVFDQAVDESADFCSSTENAQALIDKLCLDIEDKSEVEQFRDKANQAINNMLNS